MHTASRRTILRSIAALLAADFARGDTKHSRRFPFVQWDVFSKVRLAGNPLVVFPDARGLSDEEMQAITREIHQQETTFVIPREPRVEDKEGIRVRIFLPTKEVPFAGHPSLGTAMALQALWKQRNLPLRKVVRLACGASAGHIQAGSRRLALRRNGAARPAVFLCTRSFSGCAVARTPVGRYRYQPANSAGLHRPALCARSTEVA